MPSFTMRGRDPSHVGVWRRSSVRPRHGGMSGGARKLDERQKWDWVCSIPE
jgi:hypothetical protein